MAEYWRAHAGLLTQDGLCPGYTPCNLRKPRHEFGAARPIRLVPAVRRLLLAIAYIRLVWLTSRVERRVDPAAEALLTAGRPFKFAAFWHGRILLMPYHCTDGGLGLCDGLAASRWRNRGQDRAALWDRSHCRLVPSRRARGFAGDGAARSGR